MRACGLALLAGLAAAAAPARAERLILSLSTNRLTIGPNFAGAQLVAFGVVERDGQSVARPGSYAVVVTLYGPRETVTVRRKARIGPIWINRDQTKFAAVPAVLGVFSTGRPADLADAGLRERLRIGLQSIIDGPDFNVERGRDAGEFRAALLRLKRRDRTYVENGQGVTFVTSDVFRAPLPLPATAPPGNYDVDTQVLSAGVVVARGTASFELVKSGFEERISELARDNALLYGLGTAATALLFGWVASVVFRRD